MSAVYDLDSRLQRQCLLWGGLQFPAGETWFALPSLQLSPQRHRLGSGVTFCGASIALEGMKSGCNPHGYWVFQGKPCP